MKEDKMIPNPKFVCSCGSEYQFEPPVDWDDYDIQRDDDDDEARYVTFSGLGSWANHDEAGFECNKCGESIWWFA